MKKAKKLLAAILSASCLAAGALGLAACSHTHSFSESWSHDDEGLYHWHDCGGCDEVSDKAAHSWNGGVVTKAAICLEEGVKTFTCTDCGETKTQTVPKTDHSWDAGVTTVQPDCQTNEVLTFTCTVPGCGETLPVTGEKGSHNLVWYKNADKHRQECTVQGCGYKTAEVDHIWNDGEITTEATATTTGVKTFTCTQTGCGATYTQTLPVLGHTHTPADSWVKTDPDEHWKQCTDDTCHEKLEKAGHDWDDGTVTTPSTCITQGVKTFTCTTCKATKTEDIETIDHSYAESWSWDETHYHKCTTEGCTATQNSAVHVWSSGHVSKQPTAWEEGVMTFTCAQSGCGATKTEPVAIEPEVIQAGAAVTADKPYIQYRLNITSSAIDQYCNVTLNGDASVKYHVYAFSDKLELQEIDDGMLTASGAVTMPAGTVRVILEVTSEEGVSFSTNITQAMGGKQNPEAITLGTSKSHSFTRSGEYWYSLTLAEDKKVTVISAEAEGVTVALYAEDGETALATVTNGLCVAELRAGKYLVKTASETEDDVSVSVREYSEEDLGKASGAPKALTANRAVNAEDGASYFVFTTVNAGVLKTADGATVIYYSDSGFKTAISAAEGGVSLGKNATVYVFIDFGETESVTFSFTEASVYCDYEVTFTLGGSPLKNAQVKVTDSTGGAVGEELTTDDDGKVTFNALAGTYTVALTGYEYNSPYKATSVEVTATEEDENQTVTGLLDLVGRDSLTVTLPIPAEDIEIILCEDLMADEPVVKGRSRTNEEGVAVVYYDYTNGDRGVNRYVTIGCDAEKYVYTSAVAGISGVNCQRVTLAQGNKAVAVTDFYKLLKYEITLADEDGNPLEAGITVTIKDGSDTYTAGTNADGVAVFDEAIPGKEYALTLSGDYSTSDKTSATENKFNVSCAKSSGNTNISGGTSDNPAVVGIGGSTLERSDADNGYFKFIASTSGKYSFTLDNTCFKDVTLNGTKIITFSSNRHTVSENVETLKTVASGRNNLVTSFAVEMAAGDTLIFNFNASPCNITIASS